MHLNWIPTLYSTTKLHLERKCQNKTNKSGCYCPWYSNLCKSISMKERWPPLWRSLLSWRKTGWSDVFILKWLPSRCHICSFTEMICISSDCHWEWASEEPLLHIWVSWRGWKVTWCRLLKKPAAADNQSSVNCLHLCILQFIKARVCLKSGQVCKELHSVLKEMCATYMNKEYFWAKRQKVTVIISVTDHE